MNQNKPKVMDHWWFTPTLVAIGIIVLAILAWGAYP